MPFLIVHQLWFTAVSSWRSALLRYSITVLSPFMFCSLSRVPRGSIRGAGHRAKSGPSAHASSLRCGSIYWQIAIARFFNLSGAALINVKGSDALAAFNQRSLMRLSGRSVVLLRQSVRQLPHSAGLPISHRRSCGQR